jgi:hypothetical protein
MIDIHSKRQSALIMFTAALLLNFLWEMLQMRAYAATTNLPWQETILTCAFASVGDAAITGGVYLIVAIATRDWTWGFKATLKLYALAVVLGALSQLQLN